MKSGSWVRLPLGVCATVRRVYQYGGVLELISSLFDAAAAIARPAYGWVFNRRVPARYWPEFSPELLLSSEYRKGPWRGLNTRTGDARNLDSLAEVCDAFAIGNEHIVRFDSWLWASTATSAISPLSVSAQADDRDLLQHFFDRLYAAQDLHVRVTADQNDYKLVINPTHQHRVSVIIPTRDQAGLLEAALRSVEEFGAVDDVEIIIVDNGSVEVETEALFERLRNRQNIQILRDEEGFNWSRLNNLATKAATGDVLVFLNNDVAATASSRGWLHRLTAMARLPGVGCVGPMLLYADGTIQHAGVVVGMGRWADHIFKHVDPDIDFDETCFIPPKYVRPVLALTGACLVVSRTNFEALAGFDESLVVVFSDIEFCIRAHRLGLRNLYVGDVRLYHYESKSRDPKAVPVEDFRRARVKLEPFRTRLTDPYFHPRLNKLSQVPKSDLTFTNLLRWAQ
jgi:GT2 family glycosyltransferase